jgi:hypothetical protein
VRFWALCLERRWTWIPALLLLGINGVLYLGYRTLLSERFDLATLKRERLEKDYQAATARRDSLAKVLEGWRSAGAGIEEFYRRVGRREERLPALLGEIDELARRVGTVPHRIAFGQSELRDAHLEEFSISFPFEGDYASVRSLLNLLEVTPSFLILDGFSLSSSGDLQEKVRLQFKLRTVFHREPLP